MRGVKSFAMVLCVSDYGALYWCTFLAQCCQATSKGGKDAGIELIQPPANSKPGDKVYFEGPDYESEFLLANI
jgi:aminoacyl tRNA synthase complex-interacting multifunctional protein 1